MRVQRFAILFLLGGASCAGLPADGDGRGPDGGGALARERAPQASDSSFIFAVAGDYGIGAGDRDDADPANEKAVADMIDSWDVDYIVTVGDNNYNHGSADTIDANIGQYYADYIYPYQGSYSRSSSAPDYNRFWPAVGDHDYTNSVDGNADSMLDYFTFLDGTLYFAKTIGDVQLFVVDSTNMEVDGNDSDSTQATWFKSQMGASTATWRLLFQHNPVYSTWLYNVPNMPDSYDYPERPDPWPLDEWGVRIDAFIAGDEHVVERLYMDKRPYLVNGTGGAKLMSFPGIAEDYGFGMTDPQIPTYSLFRYAASWGAMKVYGDSDSITFEQWAIPDTTNAPTTYVLLDSYTLRSEHYCFSNPTDSICETSASIRFPYWTTGQDLMIAPYRGYWGYDDGAPAENSVRAVTAAASLSSNNSNAVVVDVTVPDSGDDAVAFHDSNLLRLTGTDALVSTKTSAELTEMTLLGRDGQTTSDKIAYFADILEAAVDAGLLVIVEINDLGQGKEKWLEVAEEVALESYEMEQYVTIKTPYSPSDLADAITNMTSLYYIPTVDDSFTSQSNICDYINDWENNYGSNVLAYEVQFTSADDLLLESFLCTTQYDTQSLAAGVFIENTNVLEFIKNATGKRVFYSALNPDGPRGTASKSGWTMQDTSADFSGDFVQVLNQYWAKYMLISTTRPDVDVSNLLSVN